MPAGRPRKPHQRIAPTDYDALLTRWLHGATVRELAAAYGVRYQTIQYHLKRAAKDCETELVRTAQQRILELADLRALLWQRLETTDDGWQILALARGGRDAAPGFFCARRSESLARIGGNLAKSPSNKKAAGQLVTATPRQNTTDYERESLTAARLSRFLFAS